MRNQEDPKLEAAIRLLEDEEGAPRHGGDYTVVNGLVDLRAKHFTPWQSQEPHFAGMARADVEAAWSEDDKGVRYGVLFNNHQGNSYEVTVDLQLVVAGPGGAHLTDLKPAADAAIKTYLRKRAPKDAARYAWIHTVEPVDARRPAPPLFKGETLSLPFTAAFSQETRNVDAGWVSFALPQGTVTGTVSDPVARKSRLP